MLSSISEQCRDAVSQTFSRLTPDHVDEPTGMMSGMELGPLIAYQVSGSQQTLRRTTVAVRLEPIDRLKLCLQLGGAAIVSQNSRQVHIKPKPKPTC